MPKFVGSSFVLLSLLSCQSRKPANNSTPKDAVVNTYLNLLDSSGNADSNDLKYKILKSYLANDSSFFTNLSRNLDIYRQELEEEQRINNCTTGNLPIQSYDEAYRFYWSGPLCNHRIVITVGKQKDSIRLCFIEFQSSPGANIPCTVTGHADKSISGKEWKHLKTSIDFAYFWSLEPNEDTDTTDGADWKVEGFIAANPQTPGHRFHSVYRHSPGIRAFSAIGFEMLKLSGKKAHCFY